MRSPVRLVVAILALPAMAACKKVTGLAGTPLARINLSARTSGSSFTTAPTANFYRAGDFAFISAAAATDGCVNAVYPPLTQISAEVIGGGSGVAIELGARKDTLRRVTTVDGTYKSADAGILFTPGDSIKFTIPGDLTGFPPMTVMAKTAPKFTITPVTVPASGAALNLTWTAGSGDAAMLVSLRYNNGTGTPDAPNMHISCDFFDDGSATVPATLATLWATSPAAARSVVFTRLQTAVQRSLTGTAWANVISTFTVPTPVSP